MIREEVLSRVADYYSAKVREHGPTARGVDWNCAESQSIRFEQLLKIVPGSVEEFSILDFGCGYGGLIEVLEGRGVPFRYFGYDVSEEMISRARRLYRRAGCEFSGRLQPGARCDYAVASGVFNVKLDAPVAEWLDHVLVTLGELDRLSAKGFAFNVLTSYSDPEHMRGDLFYADPCQLFDHCKRRFSRQVALLHDYGLYEFTLLVRKDVG